MSLEGALQPEAAAASITTGMPEDVEQLLRERRYDRALERLLDDYQHKVYRMVLAMLRDTGRAEDVTQDVFVKLWRALPLYDGRAAIGTWLYTIARNTCLSAVRAESYRRTSALSEAVEPSAPSTTPLALSVEQCLSRLPDIQRQASRSSTAGAQRCGRRGDARPARRNGQESPAPCTAGAG